MGQFSMEIRCPNGSLLGATQHVAGTALVTKGYVQASEVEPLIGAMLTIGSVIWSVADKRGR